MKFQARLKKMNACKDAVEWCEQFDSFQEAWQKCERGDWMLWLIGKQIKNIEERKKLVLCACKCARLSLKYVKKCENRPEEAIKKAEKWAKDFASLNDVRAAADAAYAAAYAADAAVDAAYAAADAAKEETLKKCANIVRKFYPNYKFKEE